MGREVEPEGRKHEASRAGERGREKERKSKAVLRMTGSRESPAARPPLGGQVPVTLHRSPSLVTVIVFAFWALHFLWILTIHPQVHRELEHFSVLFNLKQPIQHTNTTEVKPPQKNKSSGVVVFNPRLVHRTCLLAVLACAGFLTSLSCGVLLYQMGLMSSSRGFC